MNESKIQWEGWGEFDGFEDFISFVNSSEKSTINSILWPTYDCPILIWLN